MQPSIITGDARKRMPAFSGPTSSQDIGATAEEDWWERNRASMSGALRMVSHGMLIASGLGVATQRSPWRVASGGIGLGAATYLSLFGKRPEPMPEGSAPAGAVHTGNVVETYSSINMLSGLCLLASGISQRHRTEMLAGAWCTSAFAIKRFAPEYSPPPSERAPMPPLDRDTPCESRVLGVEGRVRRYLHDVAGNPVKLGSDMLQVSAGMVLVDAIARKDVIRGLSGVVLAGSNYMMRETRRSDFDVPAPATAR